MNKLSRFLMVTIAASSFLFAFGQRVIERHFSGGFSTYLMLQPGGKIGNMAITTGVEEAFPLSAFCSATKENDQSIRVDCAELSVCANIAIGHMFGLMDLIPPSVGWDELIWKMTVDGHPIDLEAFGVYDFLHPDSPSGPSPVREVFKVTRLWNVVLVNPTPGMHTLRGQAQSRDGAETYTWVVNLPVAAQ
jgi:hypothetical protein